MSPDRIIASLRAGFALTGTLSHDLSAFLTRHGCPRTADHCAAVAAEARRVAARASVDPDRAEVAGWLHDVSAICPTGERASMARQLGIEVLPEEDAFPMILHQKLSVVIAREVFGVRDDGVLSAIGCHTTLRPGSSPLDRVVFVADKIAWDQPGEPPYLADLLAGLDRSIDHAALVYLRYLWDRRAELRVVHPWMAAAHAQLAAALGNP